MELFKASNQWAQRPDDERFWTVHEMLDVTRRYAETAVESDTLIEELTAVSGDDGEVLLLGRNNEARLTHWSFGQLCQRTGAPAGYLRNLPAQLACDNINHGIENLQNRGRLHKLLFHQNGSLICRAFTGSGYSRIWNYEIAERLVGLEELGWKAPPARPSPEGGSRSRPATAKDCLNLRSSFLSINEGDLIAPAGIYASDHDMFVFLVNENAVVDDGSDGGLGRGVFVSNSEVGGGAFKVTRFLYRHVCGNHIVWGAEDVQEVKIVHVGNAAGRFGQELEATLTKFANAGAGEEEARIAESKRILIGKDKDEVLDKLFGKKSLGLSRETLGNAHQMAQVEADTHGDFSPNSVWGMVNGITHLSQNSPYADERTRMDKAAGQLMTIDF